MPHPLNADLHCHSTVSDGTLSPETLAQRAQSRGVQLWALTDHDELGGQERACKTALALGLSYLTGVEISVSFAGETVHIVGLGFALDAKPLLDGLAFIRSGREHRARDMADRLAQLGIPGAYEGALRYVGNPDLISRTHFARYLVEIGACRDLSEVFRVYLGDGKPGFVPHRWASLREAVEWITLAGGLAIVAHPARYHFTPSAEYALLTEFKAHGGQGLEVVTGNHSAADVIKYADMACEFGFLASRGSDFHSPDENRVDLGGLPALPAQLTPVWEGLADRVLHP